MKLKLIEMNVKVNKNEFNILFKDKNVITGNNNYGKSFMINTLLMLLGSRSAKEKFRSIIGEKHVKHFSSSLKFVINGSGGYKTDDSDHFLETSVNITGYNKTGPILVWGMKIDDEVKNISGTREYAKEIFPLIGFPTKILWTTSLTTMFMDDILRFFTLEQDSINNATNYSKILNIAQSPKIRTVITMLWFMDKKAKLIVDLIDNENLYRNKTTREIINSLKSNVKMKTLFLDGEDKTRYKDISRQLGTIENEIIKITKEYQPFREEKKYLENVNSFKDDENGLFERFLEELMRGSEVDPKIKKYLSDFAQSLKIEQEYEDIEKTKHYLKIEKEFKKNLKNQKSIKKSLLDGLNNNEKEFILNQLLDDFELTESNLSDKDLIIDGISKYYANNYNKFLKQYSYLMGVENAYTWEKQGGAKQVAENVMRVNRTANILMEQDISIPIIIDGIAAEDFSSEYREEIFWIKKTLASTSQTLFSLASVKDEKIKSHKENNIHANVWKYIDEKKININEKEIENELMG